MKKLVLTLVLLSTQIHAYTSNDHILNSTVQQAERGDLDAQVTLGNAYLFGEFEQELDYHKSAYWLKRAADQGDAASQYNLAIQYFRGFGIEKNLEQAFKYYKLAAEQGHPEAQIQLALRYLYGEGTAISLDSADYWYKQAESHADQDLMQYMDEFKQNAQRIKQQANS